MKKVFLLMVFLTILLTVFLLRTNFFSGGVIPGEPDEFVHAEIVRGLLKRPVPFYAGAPFFYDLPGFFLVSSVLFFLTGKAWLAIRLTSFLATVFLGGLLYFYARRRGRSQPSAVFLALVFLLNPLTIFYSRVGVIEPLLSLFLFGAFIFLELALLEGRMRDFFASGLFLLGATLTKYTALFLWPVFVTVFVYGSIRSSRRRSQDFRQGYFWLDLKSFLPLLVASLGLFPVLLYFYSSFPTEFKNQTLQILGFTSAAVFRPAANLDFSFLTNLYWWFGPFSILSLIGLVGVVARFFRENRLFLLVSFILFFLVISRAPFYPRYLVVLTPFLAWVASFSWEVIGSRFKEPSLKSLVFILLVVLYLAFSFNGLKEAFRSGEHQLFERAAFLLKDSGFSKDGWVFSNYWPNLVASVTGSTRFGWMSFDSREVSEFNSGEERSALEILNESGGSVFLEDVFSRRQIVASHPRNLAVNFVEKEFEAWQVVTDPQPNFPFYRGINSLRIYRIEAESPVAPDRP